MNLNLCEQRLNGMHNELHDEFCLLYKKYGVARLSRMTGKNMSNLNKMLKKGTIKGYLEVLKKIEKNSKII